MLYVENITRQTTLVTSGRVAKNPWTRLRGLLGVRHLPLGDGLLITPCNSIHTHFMSIPLDILYVNRYDEIVDMESAVRPWRMSRPRKVARYVLELPTGVIAHTGSMVGDTLRILFQKL
jgi:uncharacterized protein